MLPFVKGFEGISGKTHDLKFVTLPLVWYLKVVIIRRGLNFGHTVIFYQIEPKENGASLILTSSIARNSSAPNAKIIFEIL